MFQALDTFNTAIVSPIYYVMFTTLTILASVIMFKVIIESVVEFRVGFVNNLLSLDLFANVAPYYLRYNGYISGTQFHRLTYLI